MGIIRVIAKCYYADLGHVGYIAIDKSKHTAWFTFKDFRDMCFTNYNIGPVVKSCERIGMEVRPIKKKKGD